MDEKLDKGSGRDEFRAIAHELKATRARMRTLLARVKRTRGFRRSRRAFGLDLGAPASLPFVWAGRLEVALESVTEAIGELRSGTRKLRR